MAETASDSDRALTHARRGRTSLAFIAGALALIALGLLISATMLPAHIPDRSTDFMVSPRPSPTWAPMPTRAEAPAAALPLDLTPLHQALLQGDTNLAQRIWDDARAVAPEDSGVQQAGARLALMQGAPDVAETRIWRAIRASPKDKDAHAWSLLGVILRQRGEDKAAAQAINVAITLDPTLAPDLFDVRWRAARRTNDTAALITLAETFLQRYPESPLVPYYRAEALLATDAPLIAIELLVTVLETQPQAPALLWHTLGRAYLARGGFQEAATSLEVAASMTAQGDDSLYLVTDQPVNDLSRRLADAYLASGKCAEAESIFRRLDREQGDDTRSVYDRQIRAAVICQTPTPTLTPWIPSQQVTATPTP